nr:peptidase C13 family [Tanacetum cinerariifolium]
MKTLEYSSPPQQKEGTCSMWEKSDDITFAQDVISTLHKFSVKKTIGLTYMAINVEVDYRGYEVTVENFLRVFMGRLKNSVPRSKLATVRNDLEVVKAASTPESSDESTKPVEISRTL